MITMKLIGTVSDIKCPFCDNKKWYIFWHEINDLGIKIYKCSKCGNVRTVLFHCPKCGAEDYIDMIFAISVTCPYCGYKFNVDKKEVEEFLVKIV